MYISILPVLNGCPWDDKTCTFAAAKGHLEVLKRARANGCPWDGYICAYAAKNGRLEVLKQARANGYPLLYMHVCCWEWQHCELNTHHTFQLVMIRISP